LVVVAFNEMAPPSLDYTANKYIAVHLSSSSPCLSNTELLSSAHSALSYAGPVGALDNVLLVGVPKPAWDDNQSQILDALRAAPGVTRVDVQEEKQRYKRGGGEL
jgi:hypothetical protein